MLAGLKDWRTTLLGLALAVVMVAAMFARPDWGATELAGFAAALGTALLGLFSKFPANLPADPMADTKP